MNIKGRVVVAKGKRDYLTVKKGTILVAKNTQPDLVMVIDKIAAIVTEIDSQLSHQAIIAREFQKPLLMGIKNATKAWKTGDRVVVDFDNKVVKEIK